MMLFCLRLPTYLTVLFVLAATLTFPSSCSAWIPTTTTTCSRSSHYSLTTRFNNRRIQQFQFQFQLNAIKTDEELLPAIREAIDSKEATNEWNDCIDYLTTELSLPSKIEAEIMLSLALEWRGWARVTSELARKYMKPKLPNLQQLQSSLEWLRNGPLGLSESDEILLKAIQSSPQTYLINPEGSYVEALKTAPKAYKDPTIFHQCLLEDPTILECSYNCVDDGCASECGNCWVSYEIKKNG